MKCFCNISNQCILTVSFYSMTIYHHLKCLYCVRELSIEGTLFLNKMQYKVNMAGLFSNVVMPVCVFHLYFFKVIEDQVSFDSLLFLG